MLNISSKNLKFMKNLLLLIILFPLFASAQIVAFDTQHKNDRGYVATLSAHNHIITMVDGMTCDDFFLTTDNGVLYKDKRNCTWSYVPHREHYGWIYFNKIVDGDTVVFHKKQLKIELMPFLPTFAPFFSEKHETLYLTKEQFLSSRLYMSVHYNYYDKPVNLSSFEVQIMRGNEQLLNKRVDKIDYEVYMESVKWFNELEPGDTVTFSKIKYEYPNLKGEPFVFETYNIQIKIK